MLLSDVGQKVSKHILAEIRAKHLVLPMSVSFRIYIE